MKDPKSAPRRNIAEMRAVRPIVWPAYAVAAACLLVALISAAWNISLNDRLRQAQTDATQLTTQHRHLLQELANDRAALIDLTSSASQRYDVASGQVVRKGQRAYLALNALPAPPKGKVYEVWTGRTGSVRLAPSVTFVPDNGGVAVVQIPGEASTFSRIEVTAEPEGGSKEPTGTPLFDVTLN